MRIREKTLLAFLLILLFTFVSCRNRVLPKGDYSLEIISRAEAFLNPEVGVENDIFEVSEDMPEQKEVKAIPFDKNGIPLELSVLPVDSRIILNGNWVDNGIYLNRYKVGSTLYAEFEREGFRKQTMTITVTEGITDFRVELEPHPIVRRISVPPGEGVGYLVASGLGVITYVNSKGVLISVDVKTEEVLESELSSFIELNETSGRQVSLGRRITPYGLKILFPQDNSLLLIDPQQGGNNVGSGKLWSYPLPFGSRMSAGIWSGNAVIADQVGTVHLISLDSGQSRGYIKTNCFQPRGFAPVISGNRAVIVGRGGVVAVIDLANLSVIKEIKIEGRVIDSPVAGSAGIYLFGKNVIYGFSWIKDDFLYKIEQVACAPLLSYGRLYFGTVDGRFFIADAATGRILKSTTLGLQVECRPVALSQKQIAVKTADEILILNTAGMVE